MGHFPQVVESFFIDCGYNDPVPGVFWAAKPEEKIIGILVEALKETKKLKEEDEAHPNGHKKQRTPI